MEDVKIGIETIEKPVPMIEEIVLPVIDESH